MPTSTKPETSGRGRRTRPAPSAPSGGDNKACDKRQKLNQGSANIIQLISECRDEKIDEKWQHIEEEAKSDARCRLHMAIDKKAIEPNPSSRSSSPVSFEVAAAVLTGAAVVQPTTSVIVPTCGMGSGEGGGGEGGGGEGGGGEGGGGDGGGGDGGGGDGGGAGLAVAAAGSSVKRDSTGHFDAPRPPCGIVL